MSQTIAGRTALGLVATVAVAVGVNGGDHGVTAQSSLDPTAALLAEIIRVDTSNPPGHEGAIAELLAPRFRAAGFDVDIVPTPESGKSHFIARLKGDGSKRPVLLAAHADVVGVEREKWTVDPFGGVIGDGYVFGRGAIDFKGGMAVFARAALMLAERKVPLARDMIFLAFLLTLARTSAPPMSDHFRALSSDDPDVVRRADREVSKDPLLHAIIRNTIAPVLMGAGFRTNVIPGSAEATVNVRMIPGTNPADIVREFERVIGEPMAEVRLAGSPSASVPASPVTTDLYRVLEAQARVQFPGVEVTPYLFQAGTDARAWRARGVPTYGIYPYPIDAEDLSRMHGNDERVSIESLRQGTEMIFRTLVAVASLD